MSNYQSYNLPPTFSSSVDLKMKIRFNSKIPVDLDISAG